MYGVWFVVDVCLDAAFIYVCKYRVVQSCACIALHRECSHDQSTIHSHQQLTCATQTRPPEQHAPIAPLPPHHHHTEALDALVKQMLNEPPTNEYTPKAHQQLSTNPSSIPTISHTMPVPTHALQPYACVLESARPPQYRNALHTPSRQRRNTSKVHALSSKFPDNDPVDNPDFDDLVLDDEYYKEMGMTQADIEAQMAFKASDVDPLVSG